MDYRNLRIAVAGLLLLVVTGCQSRATDGPRWYKGNLHTHSLWSDGDEFPEVIADWYRSHDYDFLAISDHNVMLEGERWMGMADIRKRAAHAALNAYLADPRWRADTRGDKQQDTFQVRLKTLEEFRAQVEEPGRFLLIPSEELSAVYSAKKTPIHINATNLAELIKPINGETAREVMAANLRAVREQAARLGRVILPHINHPNFVWAITAEDLAGIVEERFFEVYNGHPIVNHLGDPTHPPVERLWDVANTIRLAHLKASPLMGLACDDSHNYRRKGLRAASPGRGWIMVRADDLKPESIIAAMERGDFYASSGVTLQRISYAPQTRTLEIDIEPDGLATFTTRFIGTRRGFDAPATAGGSAPALAGNERVGELLATAHGRRVRYQLTGDELYVRAVVTSSRSAAVPVYAGQRQQAWTQPVGWEPAPSSPAASAR